MFLLSFLDSFFRLLCDDASDMGKAWGNSLRGVLLRVLVFGVAAGIGFVWAVVQLDPYVSRIR